MTWNRKVRQDAFYLYKAYWNKTGPFVHLCGSRYLDRAEPETEVKVYSNQKKITLYVDGQEKGCKEGEHIFRFRLALTGEHEITAKAEDGSSDTLKVCRVEEPNLKYVFAASGTASNWFDEEDFMPGSFFIRDTLGTLMGHSEAGKLVGEIMAQATASRGEVAPRQAMRTFSA